MTCPRATTSILVPKALWAEEEKNTLKAVRENTIVGGQKHEAQKATRQPEGDVMSSPCRCVLSDCHQEYTGAAAQWHMALSWLFSLCCVCLRVALGDRVLSGCVWAHGGSLLDLRKACCVTGSPFSPILSLTHSFSVAGATTLFWRENHGSRQEKLWKCTILGTTVTGR